MGGVKNIFDLTTNPHPVLDSFLFHLRRGRCFRKITVWKNVSLKIYFPFHRLLFRCKNHEHGK